MTETIAIIDYGMGNLHSAAKALEHVAPAAKVIVTADADQIQQANRVVFPGVGAIRDCMAAILEGGFHLAVTDALNSGKPVLAICVGMQALMTASDENQGVPCINLIDGQVHFFGNPLLDDQGQRLKVPHMGWNQVKQTQEHPLWHNIPNQSRFYFVHSYYVDLANAELAAGLCDYGNAFVAALCKDNLFAVQFHPEKSANAGLQLLRNFSEWQP